VSETVRHAVGSLSEKRSPIVVGDEEIFAAHVGGRPSVELKALDPRVAPAVAQAVAAASA
jgi:hypothetical protein